MKLTKSVIDLIVKNGGGTFTRSLEDANLKKGFMVSLPNHEQVMELETASKVNIKSMVDAALQANAYIGTWLSSGMLYLDLSIQVDSLEEAMKLGLEYNQLAIYDNERQTVIDL